MKKISVFLLSENFQFLETKFSIYLNSRIFVMCWCSQPNTRRIKTNSKVIALAHSVVTSSCCSKFYRRHYELVCKYDTGQNTYATRNLNFKLSWCITLETL